MLEHFHPAVTRWFGAKVPAPRAPQLIAWPAIAGRECALIGAPTGPGKTLAAFLTAIDRLVLAVVGGELPGGTQIAHVSPLKALWNKIRRRAQIG
jgi:ATP-dependent Lhr-like helicase